MCTKMKTLLFFLLFASICYSQQQEIPIASKILLDNVNTTEKSAVTSVFMVINKKLSKKGSSFLIKDGPIITNAHVVTDCNPEDLVLISIFGEILNVKEIKRDTIRDLAALIPVKKITGGVELAIKDTLKLGSVVTTWGFPLGYNGPAPLLSVGFLSGYSAQGRADKKGFVKHLVVNGAFNPGNSGGPLFLEYQNKVFGVVVSKHAPISDFVLSALKAFENNKSGFTYTGTDDKGNKVEYMESAIVAKILKEYRELSQVMIGEAISLEELKSFLKENKFIK